MIKGILKKVLPETFLRKAYQNVVQLRRATIDKVLFPEYPLQQADFVIRRDDFPFRLYPVATAHLEPRLIKQFEGDKESWTQDEFVLCFDKPCIIEPRWGWALAEGKLIYSSLGFGRAAYVPRPARDYQKHAANAKHYKAIISLRDTGEKNYFHFHNDVLSKLFFLKEKLGVGPEVPVLISEQLYNMPYFQYYLKNTELKQYEWVLQKDNYITADKAYFCKPLTHTKKSFDWFLQNTPNFATGEQNNKIFITRSKKRIRHIENIEVVEDICRKHGFTVIDCDSMSMEEQMKTFAAARYVIGIHGAGMTNMIYRRGLPLSVLEIFAAGDYYPFHFVLLAARYGYHYDGFIGEPPSEKFSTNLIIDPVKFEEKLKIFAAS